MAVTRIVLQIENMRCFTTARFEFQGLNILIGETGAGKSTILEAFELARIAATHGFHSTLDPAHGGCHLLARVPDRPFGFSLQIEDNGEAQDWLRYELAMQSGPNGMGTHVHREKADGNRHKNLFEQDAHSARYFGDGSWQNAIITPGHTMLFSVALGDVPGVASEVARIQTVLAALQIHLPFTPNWLGHATQRFAPARRAQVLLAADSLAPQGQNLVSVLMTLKNSARATWDGYLALVRQGLDLNVEDVNIKPGGAVALRLAGGTEIPAGGLSNGQLAWLAWSAILRSPRRPSVLLLDEPDAHLHPALVATLARELADYARATPVVVATHAAQFLDAVENPAQQVTILRMDGDVRAVPRKWSAEGIRHFMEQGRSIGQMRDDGLLTPLEET